MSGQMTLADAVALYKEASVLKARKEILLKVAVNYVVARDSDDVAFKKQATADLAEVLTTLALEKQAGPIGRAVMAVGRGVSRVGTKVRGKHPGIARRLSGAGGAMQRAGARGISKDVGKRVGEAARKHVGKLTGGAAAAGAAGGALVARGGKKKEEGGSEKEAGLGALLNRGVRGLGVGVSRLGSAARGAPGGGAGAIRAKLGKILSGAGSGLQGAGARGVGSTLKGLGGKGVEGLRGAISKSPLAAAGIGAGAGAGLGGLGALLAGGGGAEAGTEEA